MKENIVYALKYRKTVYFRQMCADVDETHINDLNLFKSVLNLPYCVKLP